MWHYIISDAKWHCWYVWHITLIPTLTHISAHIFDVAFSQQCSLAASMAVTADFGGSSRRKHWYNGFWEKTRSQEIKCSPTNIIMLCNVSYNYSRQQCFFSAKIRHDISYKLKVIHMKGEAWHFIQSVSSCDQIFLFFHKGDNLTLKMPRYPASENVICLCRLLNILANFLNLFLHTGKQCGPWSDCS